jgi:NAD(P)-dependent dehydrogenase (short-subunit alcohol dehydrogenase family)
MAPNSAWTFTPTLHKDLYPAINPSTNPSLSHPGKAILITGAGRGIGRSIALRYAEAGPSSLIIASRTLADLDTTEAEILALNLTAPPTILKLVLDVTDGAAVANAAEKVKKEVGRLDVLINNAGWNTKWTPLASSDPVDYWRVWEAMVKSVFLMLHAFLPLLVQTGEEAGAKTHVVNVSSIGAVVLAPGASAYQTSKLAVVRLTEFVEMEYGDRVCAASVHPGGVLTGMSEGEESIRPCKWLTDWNWRTLLWNFADIVYRPDRLPLPCRRLSCLAYQPAAHLAERALRERELGRRGAGSEEG